MAAATHEARVNIGMSEALPAFSDFETLKDMDMAMFVLLLLLVCSASASMATQTAMRIDCIDVETGRGVRIPPPLHSFRSHKPDTARKYYTAFFRLYFILLTTACRVYCVVSMTSSLTTCVSRVPCCIDDVITDNMRVACTVLYR